MAYYFNSDIDDESANNLISAIDTQIKGLKEGEKVSVYFTSNGGSCFAGDAILHYLNANKDSIQLYCTGMIASAAFNIYGKFKGDKKVISTYSEALIHLSSSQLWSNGIKDGHREGTHKETLRLNHKEDLKWLKKIGLSKKQLKKVANGEDLCLSYDQLIKLKLD